MLSLGRRVLHPTCDGFLPTYFLEPVILILCDDETSAWKFLHLAVCLYIYIYLLLSVISVAF